MNTPETNQFAQANQPIWDDMDLLTEVGSEKLRVGYIELCRTPDGKSTFAWHQNQGFKLEVDDLRMILDKIQALSYQIASS